MTPDLIFFIMKYLTLLFALLFLGIVINESTKPATVSPHVKQYIQETSEGHVAEAITCLEYFEVGDHLVIYDYNIPQHTKQTQEGTHSAFCEKGDMPMHNHPTYYKPIELTDYYFIATGDFLKHKWQMVYMSGPDIRSAAEFYPEYTAVAANGSFGWWTKEQYRRAFLDKALILRPFKDQTLWMPKEFEATHER